MPQLPHPCAEVSVIGVPSAEWGEDVLAFVVLHEGRDCGPETLDAWCRARMAGFKRPKRWRFLDDLPKNAYGKILKTELRALDAAGISTLKVIGDACAPAAIVHAVYAGHRYARELDEPETEGVPFKRERVELAPLP